jgi:hypothetical protein
MILAAQGGRVAVSPGHGVPHLAHDLVHGHTGSERIVDHGHGMPGLNQRRRDKAEVLLVEELPVAPMDADAHGRIGRLRRKPVQRLPRRLAVGQVQAVRQGTPYGRALAIPAVEMVLEVEDLGAQVVLRVQPRLVVAPANELVSRIV